MEQLKHLAQVHVRFQGRSLDVARPALGLAADADDRAVKRAVALYLEAPETSLAEYAVDRHLNGNLTVRPPAVFG